MISIQLFQDANLQSADTILSEILQLAVPWSGTLVLSRPIARTVFSAEHRPHSVTKARI